MKMKVKLMLILVVIILLGGLIYSSIGLPWNYYKYKSEFQTYLNEKYDGEFGFKEISFDAIHGTYHATAFDKSNPDLEFYVGQNITDKKISDGYNWEKLKIKAEQKISSILKKHLSIDSRLNVDMIDPDKQKMEIIIWVEGEVNQTQKDLILSDIEDEGYHVARINYVQE